MRTILRRLRQFFACVYARIYARLCGSYPNLRPWHFQWSAVKDLNADLREALPLLAGRVLDVGCGGKPYRTWCTSATDYVGIDFVDGPAVDFVIHPNQPWPLPSASFDALLGIQTLATVRDPVHVVGEMARVLHPGGMAVVSASFLVASGAAPNDFRRYSAEGLRLLLGEHFVVTTLRREGGIGSTLALLMLGWMQARANQSRSARLLQAFFLPMWIAFCGALNMAGAVLDAVDPTRGFYTNVLVVAVRKNA